MSVCLVFDIGLGVAKKSGKLPLKGLISTDESNHVYSKHEIVSWK